MAKKNYTKVEEALEEGLRKMKVDALLELADEMKKGKTPSQLKKEEAKLLKALNLDLTHLHKQGNDPYKKLGIDKKEINKYLEHPEDLTENEWAKIKKIKEEIEGLKKEMQKVGTSSDEEIIKNQVKEQKNKRFNIRDNWLPLH